jgi:hypothetical protein
MRRVKLRGAVQSLLLIGVWMAGVMAAESGAAELWVTNMSLPMCKSSIPPPSS